MKYGYEAVVCVGLSSAGEVLGPTETRDAAAALARAWIAAHPLRDHEQRGGGVEIRRVTLDDDEE
jgi:hypothetical protein